MQNSKTNIIRAQKLHVLAALEVERYRKKALDLTQMSTKGKTVAATTAATLDTLMTADAESRADGVGSAGSKVSRPLIIFFFTYLTNQTRRR